MKRVLPSLSILIPAYNDAATIESLITDVESAVAVSVVRFEIIVINDASTDETGRILNSLIPRHKNLRVIHHATNAGYGGTIRELYATGRCKWLFTLPGDHQIGADQLQKLLPFIDTGDMIIGWRVHRQDPKARLRQSRIYNELLQILFGLRLRDVNSVRLMRSSILQKITLESSSAFVDAELAVKARRAGFSVIEAEIAHRPRSAAGAGGGSLKTILPTIRDLVKFRLLHGIRL